MKPMRHILGVAALAAVATLAITAAAIGFKWKNTHSHNEFLSTYASKIKFVTGVGNDVQYVLTDNRVYRCTVAADWTVGTSGGLCYKLEPAD